MTIATRVSIVGLAVCTVAVVQSYVIRYGAGWAAKVSSKLEPVAPAHLDHRPRHGGLVLMNGDLHYEVVLTKDGACAVFFSDAFRAPLPASLASTVEIGWASADDRGRTVSLQIDSADDAWTGHLAIMDSPSTTVRISYLAHGEQPYWIDVPLEAWPAWSGGHR